MNKCCFVILKIEKIEINKIVMINKRPFAFCVCNKGIRIHLLTGIPLLKLPTIRQLSGSPCTRLLWST